MALNVRVEGGKYTIVQNEHGELRVDRGDIRGWLERPDGGNMIIALACEAESARKLLKEIGTALGPNGPLYMPELLTQIMKYMRTYQIEDQDCIEGEI
jgi:hypothetical protein